MASRGLWQPLLYALAAASLAGLLAGAIGGGQAALGANGHPRTRWYLALGDSLSTGMQPDAAGITRNTGEGYVDRLYAIERRRVPGLRLVKLGCGGETTASFLSGRGNPDALLLGCHPAGGSQMAAALRFLHRHRRRGEVAFITLDIGANDVDGCISGANVDVSCVTRGVASAERNLPAIMRRLRKAAAPGTPLVSMTLYDPFLEIYLLPGAQTEAVDINGYALTINRELERLYRAARFRIAHVDRAFHTYDLSHLTTLPGQPRPVPVAVAEVCRLTWMCAPPPVGPNIHANGRGYGVIAQTFAGVLGRVR